MTGVVGFIGADGAPMDAEFLGRIATPLLHDPARAMRWHAEPPLHLGRVFRGGPDRDGCVARDARARRTAVIDGRIDNSDELCTELGLDRGSSDAEVLLAGFERWGERLFERLNGDFRLGIAEGTTRSLYAVTGPPGLRPLYYVEAGGAFAFASEVKALLNVTGSRPRPDFLGISSFLQHGFPLSDLTFFEGVKLLPGASYARFHDGALDVRRYWRLRLTGELPLTEEQAVDVFVSTWKDAVRREIRGSRRVGALLSGGLDSRLILAALAALGAQASTHTFGDADCADESVAKEAAAAVGYSHHFAAVDPDAYATDVEQVVRLTDGMFNYAHSGVRHLLPSLEHNVDLVLDGITLLDSFFYSVELPFRRLVERRDAEVRWLSLAFTDGGDPRAMRLGGREPVSLLSAPELRTPFPTGDYLTDYARRARDTARDLPSLLGLFDMELRQQRFTSFGPGLLRNVVSVRCPFMDKRIMDLGARLPPRYRSKDKVLQARGVVQLSPALARLPWLRNGLPPDASPFRYHANLATRFARSRLRRAFGSPAESDAPLNHARTLRERPEVRARILSILTAPGAAHFLDSSAVQTLVSDHCSGREDHGEMLGRLLTFEFWRRAYDL